METNLLPPQIKNELHQEKIKKVIIIFGLLILVFFFSLSLVLFATKVYISQKVEAEKIFLDSEKRQSETSEFRALKEKVTFANKNLSQLESFYQEKFSLLEVFEKISHTLPPQIYLTNFFYQESASQVSISGFAPQKEILVELKNNLEEEFSDVNFPLQVWTKSTDIDFQVNFKIK